MPCWIETVRNSRYTMGFTWEELPPDVQERMLQCDTPDYEWQGMLVREDFELAIQEEFVPMLENIGWKIDTREVTLMSGKKRQEPAVWWDINPYDVWFTASIDVEKYLTGVNFPFLGGKEITASVGREEGRSVEVETEYNVDDYSIQLDNELERLEKNLKDTYSDITQAMEDTLRQLDSYIGGKEWHIAQREDSGIIYDINGNELEGC
jgi:hypothetical protein